MKVGQQFSSETTFNTQDCTIVTEKYDLMQKQNQQDSQSLYNQEQQADDSFEMVILSNSHPENEWIKKELSIVSYFKLLGLKMKTDPLEKQERFYNKPKRRPNKSSTMNLNTTSKNDDRDNENENTNEILKTMSIEMNSIKQRRTPNTTPQSSPLITKKLEIQEPIKKQRMSIFQKMKSQVPNLSSDEEEIQSNILRNQQQLKDGKIDRKSDSNSSSKSETEKDYFQNLCG